MAGLFAALTTLVFYWLVRPALRQGRPGGAMDLSPAGLSSAALGLLLMGFLLNPIIIPILVIAIAVHEYGHVLAYRLIGHSAPRFRLAPFGGVAMSSEPIRTEGQSAFVSLMGPGFSLALVAIVAAATEALEGTSPGAALYAYQAAALIGLLNLFNLAPVFPLDGGRVIASLFSPAGRGVTRIALVAMSLGSGLALAAADFPILAVLAGFGAALAWRVGAEDPDGPPPPAPITMREAVWVVLAYGASIAAHGLAAVPYLARFGLLGDV